MQNRRSFLQKAIIISAAILVPAFIKRRIFAEKQNRMKAKNPRRAAVLWYSQAGHTERVGKLIAKRWQMAGLSVDASDIRDFDAKTITEFDLIAIGSPVYYLEVPENVREWISSMPETDGIPVASFVTFGGPGHNQHNTACEILELSSKRGGVPAGMSTFGNMSTFALTWSSGNSARVLEYKHLPNEVTYTSVRAFASEILKRVRHGEAFKIDTEFSFFDLLKIFNSWWFTKLMLSNHRIDPEKCIKCGTCVKKCPVGAIDLDTNKVDTSKCIACMGCVNNCPVQAVCMKIMGDDVYGFNRFLKDNNIIIKEPEELRK